MEPYKDKIEFTISKVFTGSAEGHFAITALVIIALSVVIFIGVLSWKKLS